MTDLLDQARTIIHDSLIKEFLAAHRERPVDPTDLLADLDSYCRTFGISAPQR